MNPLKFVFTRAFLPLLFLILEVGLLAFMVSLFEEYFVYFFWISLLFNIIVLIFIINSKTDSAYKIAWIIPVLSFPIFGALLYILYGGNKFGRKMRIEIQKLNNKTSELLKQNKEVSSKLSAKDKDAANQSSYITNNANTPIYDDSTAKYFELGDSAFVDMLEELKKAKEYIFLEYFIIAKGRMWDEILEILVKKVKEGVDVRVIYDDIGCLFTLPLGYNKHLEKLGIKCLIFHPLKLLFSTKYNNRDHRKILVIDGAVAYTGGINLADEYINEYEKYGHWKDCVLKVKGDAVSSFTILFLTMWEYLSNEKIDYDKYLIKNKELKEIAQKESKKYLDGFIQPFSDSPLDNEPLGEIVYCNILGNASDYVYITTPYLIINDAMKSSICSAAKRGVDVRILLPHIPDKPYVHTVTKSNYDDLLEANVRIYEYTPGFIHSKTFISDDKYGVVGTINLDYRSLYLHFECGVWMYESKCIEDIKKDFLETIEISHEVTLENKPRIPILVLAMRSFLKALSPLM